MISSLSDVAKMSCDAAAAVANKNYKRQSSAFCNSGADPEVVGEGMMGSDGEAPCIAHGRAPGAGSAVNPPPLPSTLYTMHNCHQFRCNFAHERSEYAVELACYT